MDPTEFIQILLLLCPEQGSWKELFSAICWYLRQCSICADCSASHSDMHRPAHSEQPVWEQQPEIIAATELDLKNSDLYQVKYARGSSSRKDFSSSLKTNRTSLALLWRKASHTCVNNPWYLILQGVKSLLQHVCPAGRKEQACPRTCLIFQTAPELDGSQELSRRCSSFRARQGCDLSPSQTALETGVRVARGKIIPDAKWRFASCMQKNF